MKTLNNKTAKQFLKSAGAMALALCITTGSAFATVNGNDSVKTKKEVSTEESMMIDDLLAEFEKAEELDKMFESGNISFEVYDNNDQLIFSGNQKQWDDLNNKKLISVKRKAEFLFETDGTSIYKVF